MTNTTDKPVSFQDVKTAYLESFDKVAAEYGRTRQQLIQDMTNGLIISVMFGRAARKGNVAKTIYWGVAALQRGAYMRSLREEQTRRRERAEAFDNFLK